MRSKNQHVLGIRTSSESVSCKICGVSPQGLLLEGPSGKKLLSKTSQSEDWSLASCSLTAATASSKGATAPWGSGWPKKEKPSQLTKFLCFWNALFPLWNNWIPFWNQMQHLWRICDECSMAAGLQSWHPSEGVYQPPDFIHSTASIVSRLSYHDIWCKVVKQKNLSKAQQIRLLHIKSIQHSPNHVITSCFCMVCQDLRGAFVSGPWFSQLRSHNPPTWREKNIRS